MSPRDSEVMASGFGVLSLKILYLGRNSGTSSQRKDALLRLGHDVTHIDPYALLPANRIVNLWQWRAGSVGLAGIVRRRVLQALAQTDTNRDVFDLAWVDQGSLIGAGLVQDLKSRIPRVLCYTIDDPFGGRDKMRWRQFFHALHMYDLLVVVRACNVQEAYDRGAKKVLRVFMSADEVAHAPRQLTAADLQKWQSEVVFVGTAFPERGPFLSDLARLGVPLTIYGNRYERLPEWPLLRSHWRPANAGSTEDYTKAITAAKVCLGLLSKGNRDQHTTRSMEIPSLGGVLCAERTAEHVALYEEEQEAVFWETPEECASKCFALLADPPRREAIAAAGRQRYLRNPWRNMPVVEAILNAALDPAASLNSATSPSDVSELAKLQGKLPVEAGTAPANAHVNPPSTR
jgi:spore maturation protein CgeB